MSSVQLICHRDIWAVIDEWFVDSYGHSDTGRVPKDRIKAQSGGLVEVTLSGVSLVGLLKKARKRVVSPFSGTQAIARRTYDQVAKVIDAVDPNAAPGQPIPPIVLDDKLGEQAAG
ncbi:hypothetical protein ACWCPQ_33615 [Nocardia sp. NPDC001965]